MSNAMTLDVSLVFTVFLNLIVLHSVAIDVTLNDAYVLLGQSFWWECRVEGQRSFSADARWSYHWRFQDVEVNAAGESIVQENGTLYIKEIKEENFGSYSCVVSNSKEASESTAFLRKAFVSRPISTNPFSQTVRLGDDAAFYCNVNAKPRPSVKWFHGDEEVKDNDATRFNTTGDNGFTLEVLDVSYSHAGLYRCVIRHPLLDQQILSNEMRLDVYGEPVITAGLKPMTFPVGHDVSLSCRAQSNPKATVAWSFYPSATNSIPSPSSATSSKVSISQRNSPVTIAESAVYLNEDGNLLLITNASEGNSGLYICEWANDYGFMESNASLIVAGLPQPPTLLEQPEDQDVVEFSELRLYCSGTGNPSVTISWNLPNGSEEESGDVSESYFVLKEVTRENSGIYTCAISNSEGTITTQATVNVQYKPYIVTTAPANITVEKLSTVEIPCKADGNPIPVIKWTLPWIGMEILATSSNSSEHISFNDNNLVISDLHNHHYGIYRCIASNKIGSVSMATSVSVVSGPIIVKSLASIGATEGDEILLQCEVKSYQPPKVQWFRKHMPDPSIQAINTQKTLGMVSKDNFNVTNTGLSKITLGRNTGFSEIVSYSDRANDDYMFYLQVINVQGNDAGIYVCQVENDVGSAHSFGVVRVITFPEFTRTPSDKKVLPGVDVTLDCHSVGVPVPSLRWMFNKGKMLFESSRFVVDSNGSLSISSIKEEEFGMYTCLATNQAGQRSVHANVSMSSKPRMVNPPRNTTFLELKKGSLKCEGESDLTYSVSWYTTDESGKRTQFLGQNQINNSNPERSDGKFGDERTIHVNNRGSLVFSCIEKLHQGWYVCELKNGDGSTTSEPIFLRVETVPNVTSLTISDPEPKEGDDIELTCSVNDLSSSLNGSISWLSPQFLEVTHVEQANYPEILVKGKDVTLRGMSVHISVLTVTNVNNERHGGVWICKTCNLAGCKIAKIVLNIHGKPVVRAMPLTVNKNHIVVSCEIYGHPKTEVTYLSNSIVIGNGTEGHNITESYNLIIDSGNLKNSYSCRATNMHGSDTKTFNAPPVPIITMVFPEETSFRASVKTEIPSPSLLLTNFIIEYKQFSMDEEWESQTYHISGDSIRYINVFHDVKESDSEQTCVRHTGKNDMGFSNNPTDGTGIISIEPSISSFTYAFKPFVSNLDAYTTYSVRAKVSNVFGSSVFSPLSNIRTLPSAPPIVTNIGASVRNRSCTLTWATPAKLNGKADDVLMNVNISHKSLNNVVHSEIVPATKKPSILLNNLSLGKYFATITTFNKQINASGPSANFNFLIQDQAPSYVPRVIEIRSVTDSSIKVIWTIPDNPAALIPVVTGYSLLIQTVHSNNNIRHIQITNGSISNQTVDKLRENEDYSVRIASANQAGLSPYSPDKRVTTRFAAFSSKALGAADIDGYSVSWTLIAIIIIGAGAALVFLTAFLVFSYQFKLAKRGSIDITPEPTNDARNNDSQEEQNPIQAVADSLRDSDFILY